MGIEFRFSCPYCFEFYRGELDDGKTKETTIIECPKCHEEFRLSVDVEYQVIEQ